MEEKKQIFESNTQVRFRGVSTPREARQELLLATMEEKKQIFESNTQARCPHLLGHFLDDTMTTAVDTVNVTNFTR